jgi:hypothetical protein
VRLPDQYDTQNDIEHNIENTRKRVKRTNGWALDGESLHADWYRSLCHANALEEKPESKKPYNDNSEISNVHRLPLCGLCDESNN